MSGATGAIYGIRLLEVLAQRPEIETHLVISNPAHRTIALETDFDIKHVESLAKEVYDVSDVGARIASGSFKTDGMVIAPCSVKTLSAIANSYNDNLLVRAADVCLKERRRLVLVFRETPLHSGHIRQMLSVSEMGGILLPPMPAYYHRPHTLDDMINHTVGKMLDMFDIEHNLFKRWGSPELMTERTT
ncbi:MAG: UbiX family flavin prenyltransferase [Chloroflexota bacterium]|nr:MAG: UbiX family flavin prenyltransferase [Chloroflexota bacterium]